MGNICSPCIECEKDKYSPIKGDGGEKNFQNSLILSEFNLKSSVFEGSNVDQKFTSKQTYEPRFVWINLESQTIRMSIHNTKERRHKEASLIDVISVERGAPKRVKKIEENSFNCLTVKFQRGGGIDLRFTTDAECELWFTVLNRIVEHIKKTSQ